MNSKLSLPSPIVVDELSVQAVSEEESGHPNERGYSVVIGKAETTDPDVSKQVSEKENSDEMLLFRCSQLDVYGSVKNVTINTDVTRFFIDIENVTYRKSHSARIRQKST